MKRLLPLVFALALLAPSGADAKIGIAGKASSLGIGVEGTLSVLPMVNVRGGVNFFSYGYDGTEDDITYDFDLKLKSFAIMADLHPFLGRGLRLSAGIVFNSNGIDMVAVPNQVTFEIGGQNYTAAEVGTLNGKIDFKSTAPYLGIGWGNAASSRVGIVFDLGVAFQGAPQVDLNTTGLLSTDAQFQTDLAREEQDLRDEISGFKYYPVVGLGLSFKILP